MAQLLSTWYPGKFSTFLFHFHDFKYFFIEVEHVINNEIEIL